MEVVGLNFSSATTPELILKMPNSVILAPVQIGHWLVVFCDEINLPAPDKYGTQKVILFIHQLVECGGCWCASDMAWVKLERVQFVGSCNPPTDPGQVPLTIALSSKSFRLFKPMPNCSQTQWLCFTLCLRNASLWTSKAQLHVFYEEELDVPLVLFNNVLDHALCINCVFQQVQGHLLLIGVSGSGKVHLISHILSKCIGNLQYSRPLFHGSLPG